MDFEFPEDTLMLRDMLRRFIQKEARPLEMDYFNNGELKQEQRAKLRRSIEQLGLWGYLSPEKYGGAGLDLITSCLIEEELGGTFIPLEMGEVTPLLFACLGDQISRYLEPALDGSRKGIIAIREPGEGGIRPENWKTSVIQIGDGYVINGIKSLSKKPAKDDFFIVFAGSSDENPSRQSAFLVDPDTPGIDIEIIGSATLILNNCKVGQQTLLGEFGNALKLGASEAPKAWIRSGARYVGIVERLIEMASEHARDWISLGAPLAVRPAIQRMLAEMRVEVEGVRWMVYHAAWVSDTQGIEKIKILAAQVRLASGEMLKRAADYATLVYTGPGPSSQIELQRLVHSVIPMDALELALEQARVAIANDMLHLSILE
jgi:alkylation response protein AidB-like acyl-CoA dehydrogenase